MSLATLDTSSATQALRESPIAALRRLSINETERNVVIQGTVPSYYLKQLAQETLMPLLDGRLLLNHISVVRAWDQRDD